MTSSAKINSTHLPNNLQYQAIEKEKVLCQHCGRTATNGIKCQGICVADSDY